MPFFCQLEDLGGRDKGDRGRESRKICSDGAADHRKFGAHEPVTRLNRKEENYIVSLSLNLFSLTFSLSFPISLFHRFFSLVEDRDPCSILHVISLFFQLKHSRRDIVKKENNRFC